MCLDVYLWNDLRVGPPRQRDNQQSKPNVRALHLLFKMTISLLCDGGKYIYMYIYYIVFNSHPFLLLSVFRQR